MIKKTADYDVITLRNSKIEVQLLDVGASLIGMRLLEGKNIVLQYANFEDYLGTNGAYLGATVGPIAGRVLEGKLSVAGQDYQLSKNGEHHLHGGTSSTTYHRFSYEVVNDQAVVFKAHLSHKADGYPGVFDYEFQFELDDDSLVMTLKGIPSQPFPMNLTNHAYFNLSQDNHLDKHTLKIESETVVLVNESMANTAKTIPVAGTAFDFRSSRTLDHRLDHEQFVTSRYIDHDFIMDGKLVLETSEQRLEVSTTAPAFRLYFANYFDGAFATQWHEKAQNQSGIAIEGQEIADSYNLTQDTRFVYDKDNPFTSTTRYTLRSLHGTVY